MSIRKKAIVSLTILLAFCTAVAGCAFSTESSQRISTDSSDSSGYIAETLSSNESRDSSLTATTALSEIAAEPPAATTGPAKAPSTIKPTSIVPITTVPITTTATAKPSSIILDNLIGKSGAYITQQFGNPVAIEKSEYGFYWHVYHNNYTRFVMIGIQNNKVVGLYSNSTTLIFENITVGAAKNTIRETLRARYTGPLTSLRKGNTDCVLQGTEQRDVFTDNQKYITMFYDNINGGILTAVQIIDYSTEQSFGFYPAPDKEFTDSYERIGFYLINSIRVKHNMPVLEYDNNMAAVAAAHSQDMIDRSFFGHINPKGLGPADRIKEAGYSSFYCAENISQHHQNAISAHENYMNSSVHRVNILRDIKYVGIGVRMVQEKILQTELYITYL